MNRAYLLFIAILVLAFSLIPPHQPETIQAGGTGLNTQQLSDHSLTQADSFINIYGYDIDPGNTVAHVYWQETGNGSEGTDLFYRQIPDGSTIRLSDPALSDGDVSLVWFDTAVAPDGTFHIIWLEDTNSSEGGDLFYWSAATGTLLLSDHDETEGYVQPATNTLFITLDNDGNPHTFWHEETGTSEGEDLFFWSLATGTLLITDRTQTEGDDDNFGPNRLLIDDNGTTHITWAEIGNDGITNTYFYWNESLPNPIILPDIERWVLAGNVAHIIWLEATDGPINYWNSATQTTQPIPSSGDLSGGFVRIQYILVDSNENIRILWHEDLSNVCLAHWDSSSQTTDEAVIGERCTGFWPVYIDNTNILHTVVSDDPGGTRRYQYWNENLTNLIALPVADVSIYGWLTGIEGTNIVHFSWIEFGGTDDNFFHWDNMNQSTSNLSQLAGNDTRISSAGRQVEQSSNGELYMLWFEQINGTGTSQNLYWNSVTNTTQNLFSELGISSINLVNNSTEHMRMDFLASGSPYFMWHGVPNSGPEGLYLWDSAQDSIHLAGESYPCSEIGRTYKNDSDIFGNIYLAWQDETTWNYHFWSQETGEVALSQTTSAETLCHPPVLAVANNGNVFVLWVEESDVAGEGLDMFAGWIESTAGKIYLPLIVKP